MSLLPLPYRNSTYKIKMGFGGMSSKLHFSLSGRRPHLTMEHAKIVTPHRRALYEDKRTLQTRSIETLYVLVSIFYMISI